MQNEKIYSERIKQFIERLGNKIYFDSIPLKAFYINSKNNPVSYEKMQTMDFQQIQTGEKWGVVWDCGWFKFQGTIPKQWQNSDYGVYLDTDGESCVFENKIPVAGLTNKIHWDLRAGKYYYPLKKPAGQEFEVILETSANSLFGETGKKDYFLIRSDLVRFDKKIFELWMDMRVLYEIAENQNMASVRRKRIFSELNKILNLPDDSCFIENSLNITKSLLAVPASCSALTVYSIGHAHLDMAWLWPVRETRRKGVRTFATALQMMDEYPQYKFGASQPQLYEWVKQDQLLLFEKVRRAVEEGRWELQGAMWVEPDMNLAGSESLVRQCLYGKRFFRDEFGMEINNLWLPDVFGYSAALPQILKKCGVDYFMTMKISWNETNRFPHHLFNWQGIDGSSVIAHFLPTDDYNVANTPKELIKGEEKFSQSDITDAFLNLYGNGDGGGGPGREHIEYGIRQQDTDGVPRFKFAFAQDFFKKISEIDKSILPVWVGELYLELHRGTYTTQALMKKYNRILEQRLRDMEFISAINGGIFVKDLEKIWKDTLLNQFHDILPGSSIKQVYEDAHALSEKNLSLLDEIQNQILSKFYGAETSGRYHVFMNTLNWVRRETVELPVDKEQNEVFTETGERLFAERQDDKLIFCLTLPPMAMIAVTTGTAEHKKDEFCELSFKDNVLENSLVRIRLEVDGSIGSFFHKEYDYEFLCGPANQFLLYDDEPLKWEAWDINHYYREKPPKKPKLLERNVIELNRLRIKILQKLKIAESFIEQEITLEEGSALLRFDNTVHWQEKRKMLRLSAETSILCNDSVSEIQFGSISRPNNNNTSWDTARFEICAHRYAGLSNHSYGFAVLNDCKYGHYIKDSTIDLNLLRSPVMPDGNIADLGIHRFAFAYYVHKNRIEMSDTWKKAHEFNTPLLRFSAKKIPDFQNPMTIIGDSGNIKIEAIKPAEDGKGIVLRFYETCGRNGEFIFQPKVIYKNCYETDLLENIIEKINFENSIAINLKFKPFEIKTIKLN